MRTSNIVQKSQSSQQVSENAIAMSIDEASSVFLMDALGKLYSRPAQAVLREYLSNAIDAHKAKGGNLPAIQITLPEDGSYQGSSYLRIRDFGKGMNEEQFSTILSRYGASTKRDSNAMIGGFGLGAKSGFALSDEFFMTSYQSGQGLRVRIFKDPLNQGYIDVIERFDTKEADGMLVEVPIPRGNLPELSKKALFLEFPFFMGHEVDTLNVQPAADYASQSVHNSKSFTALQLGDNTVGWLGKQSNTSTLYGLTGKVAYRVDVAHLASLTRSNKLDEDVVSALYFLNMFRRVHVIDIPIGSVDMPSAREEITYSERSLKTLGAIICNYALLVKQQIQKELNTKTDKFQVVKFLAELEGQAYSQIRNLSWRGYSFGESFFKKSELSYSVFTRGSYGSDSVTHETSHNIKNFIALRHLSDPSEYNYGLYWIDVDSTADIANVRKLLSEKTIIQFLSLNKNLYSGKRLQTYKALFFAVPKGDALSDWLFDSTVVEVSELETIVEKEQLAQKAEEERKKAEKAAHEASREEARKAKILRAQSMLCNFTVNSGSSESLNRATAEQVFTNDKVKKYYWSEEEVEQHLISKKKFVDKSGYSAQSIHFPFKVTPVPNTFTVLSTGSITTKYNYVNYLERLRSFLRLFIEDGSKVIVVGAERDLNEFKATYPNAESAVEMVGEAIKTQVQDSTSEMMVAYNAVNDARFKGNKVLQNLSKFTQTLSDEEVQTLPEDIKSTIDRFMAMLSSPENGGRGSGLDELYFTAMIKGFVPIQDFKEKNSSIESAVDELMDKYPLLIQGEFKTYSPKAVTHMLKYIQICDEDS